MQIKLTLVFAFVLLFLAILLVRITVITTRDGNRYAKAVLSQQTYDSRSIPYRRGEIRDTNGIILGKSEKQYNVVLDCAAINSGENYKEPTITAVSEGLGIDSALIRDRIESEETAQSQYQVVKRNVTEEEKRAYEAYVSTSPDRELSDEERARLSLVTGVWFEEDYVRVYPYDSLACNVIGWSNSIDQGVCGLEQYYDSLLNGTDGRAFGYLDEDSEFRRTTIEPEHGKTLVMTLDINIQEILEKMIANFEETYGDATKREKGAKNIGIVVMDPNSGSILGMATNSVFDLNDPQDMSALYSGAELKRMDDQTYADALHAMWSNFCVSGSYEPGSVVKPITISSALEVGAVHDGDTFVCDGYEFITDTRINCDNVYGHGEETLEYAIVNSCNDALMQIGMKLKISNFCTYQRLFNFGSPTGIDLPEESAGVIYSRDDMHEVELATCTFGQGFTCSMIQQAAAFSTVVNGGYYYQPHVVRQVLNADGSVEKNIDALVLRQPISSSVSSLVRGYLKTAVQKGTGRKSQVPGYLTGGKTGTAEKINPETKTRATGKYLVSFIGAAPIDDPQVVIYVVVDEPNVPNQADSSFAQILFRQCATEIFPYMGIYPTEEVDPSLLAYLGVSQSEVVQAPAGTGGPIRQTFQCFDSYGNLYNGAYINDDDVVVNANGDPIEGAYVNEEGNVVDGYLNVISLQPQTVSTQDQIDPVAENPDIAAPPEQMDDQTAATTWDGITSEDLAAPQGAVVHQ